jgi:hypothetical protein
MSQVGLAIAGPQEIFQEQQLGDANAKAADHFWHTVVHNRTVSKPESALTRPAFSPAGRYQSRTEKVLGADLRGNGVQPEGVGVTEAPCWL